jgi:hypothetical protein
MRLPFWKLTKQLAAGVNCSGEIIQPENHPAAPFILAASSQAAARTPAIIDYFP